MLINNNYEGSSSSYANVDRTTKELLIDAGAIVDVPKEAMNNNYKGSSSWSLYSSSYETSEYPSKIISETTTHRHRGYIVVVDISQKGKSEHLARTKQLINRGSTVITKSLKFALLMESRVGSIHSRYTVQLTGRCGAKVDRTTAPNQCWGGCTQRDEW